MRSLRRSCQGMTIKSKLALWFLYLFELSVAFVGSVGLAISLYGLYYWYMIPQMQVVHPIFFDFSENDRPTAFVDFSDGYRVLHPSQAYRVSVYLDMPESEVNKNQGVFMVEIILLDAYNQTLAAAKRPGIMKYQSDLVSAISSLFYAIPLIFNLAEQKQMLEFVLMEEFIESRSYPFVTAIVTLSSKSVHIYSATMEFRATLSYLQYFMFHWFYSFSFLAMSFLTISIFMAISFFTTIAHIFLTMYVTSNNPLELMQKLAVHGNRRAQNMRMVQDASRAVSSSSSPAPLLIHPSVEPIDGGFVIRPIDQEPTNLSLRAPRVDLRFLTDPSVAASTSQSPERISDQTQGQNTRPQYSPRDLYGEDRVVSNSAHSTRVGHLDEPSHSITGEPPNESLVIQRRPFETESD